MWTPDAPNSTTGTTTELGTLVGYGNSQALAINDSGQIVGSSTVEGFEDHAFLWTPARPNGTTGEMVDLGVLPAGVRSTASGINDKGVVVGSSFFADEDGAGRRHAFRWTPAKRNATTGAMRDLGILPGDAWSFATGINRRGDVVGYDYSSFAAEDNVVRPFMSRGGTLVPFARMPAAFDVFVFTSGARVPGQFRPTAISDRGSVAGWTREDAVGAEDYPRWPVLWTPTKPNGTTGRIPQTPGRHLQREGARAERSWPGRRRRLYRALLWTLAPHGLKIAIDIKPGDASNVIKPGGTGTLPVAILSSKRFDATTVDPLTVTLANAVVPLPSRRRAARLRQGRQPRRPSGPADSREQGRAHAATARSAPSCAERP